MRRDYFRLCDILRVAASMSTQMRFTKERDANHCSGIPKPSCSRSVMTFRPTKWCLPKIFFAILLSSSRILHVNNNPIYSASGACAIDLSLCGATLAHFWIASNRQKSN